MKCGARIALGVAGGYFLGRTKKMKLALALGGWAAGRQLGGPGQMLGQAGRLLGESPELSALSDQVRGRLLEAGKDAAMAVATRGAPSHHRPLDACGSCVKPYGLLQPSLVFVLTM